MKKIIFSLAIIAIVSVGAIGATRAYFSSEVTSTGNTFSTGTLHIKDVNVDWMRGVTFDGLKPGSIVRKWIRIENDGNMDVGILTVSAGNVQNTSGLMNQLIGWTYGTIANTSDSTDGVQTGYNNDSLALLNSSPSLLTPANPVLKPGQSTTIQVQFKMPETLGNEWEGKTASLDLVFHAEQIH